MSVLCPESSHWFMVKIYTPKSTVFYGNVTPCYLVEVYHSLRKLASCSFTATNNYTPLLPSRQTVGCLDFKLSPCSLCSMFSFGYFPDVWGLKADVSEPSIGPIFLGRWRKMEPIEGSETSAFKPQTPGEIPKRKHTTWSHVFAATVVATQNITANNSIIRHA